MKTWKIAGINFDHFHMGDLLRMAHEHPAAEIVGICDEQPERMADAARNFNIPAERVFTDYRACLERTKADVVILCPAAAKHGEWTKRVAPFGAHLIMEKPFAASLAEADQMIAAIKTTGKQLAINWPLRWVESHATAKRLIDEGFIGDLIEYHHYGGNRGPLWHTADKVERTAEQVNREKPNSWFYKRQHGGGSLLDYAGYGSTLGTWLMNGRKPLEVCAMVDEPAGLEVDEHSIIICRYQTGLSKIETRWGTFTDPWTHQTQPFCGFTLVGTDGTISSADYAPVIRVQTRKRPEVHEVPVDPLEPPFQNPVQYVLDCLERERPIEGPLSIEFARIGQQIVDGAVESVRQRCPVPLPN
jgi:glucose-fructose oxidoreductase